MSAADGTRKSGPPPERRYLTIMFIDLVGYTELSVQLDAEDLLALRSRYQQLALAVMERFGGFVSSFSGDGILVYFGYPTAHGNDAERALRAALEMIKRLDGLDFVLSDGRTQRLKARFGAHTGVVIVGPEFTSSGMNVHSVVGEAPNLAARLQNEAPASGVVVSRETLGLVEDLFDFVPLGPRLLKGLSRPVETFQVIRAKPVTEYERTRLFRYSTTMVGREPALSRLLACWKRVREQSRCRTLIIVGDAGLGKTRFVNEFFSHPAIGSVALAQTQCHEIFANTALFPVASYLWKRSGLTLDDDDVTRQQKLARLLDEYGLASDESRQILASFPGLTTMRVNESIAPTPQLLKLKQYRLVISILDRVARNMPTILSVEDVHWLDPSSSELLIELAATLHDAPLLILLTTRSFPKGPAIPQANEVIYLEQLRADECLQLARSIPGAEKLPEALVARAVEAADGVPLFVEQLVLSLVDEREREPSRGRKGADLPLILAEMMSERLDRRPGGRRMVQAAACLGRAFRPEFLAAILREDARHIAETLELLVQAEILQPKRYGMELQYEFRHALLQRMARDSMIELERHAMHARVVDVLRAESDVAAPSEVIAYHLTEAGNFNDAVRSWLAAGLYSAEQSAHLEAIDHLRRGLALLDKIHDDNLQRELEITLQAALISSITITEGPTSLELFACCERGLDLCRGNQSTPQIFPFLFGQFTFANCRGHIDEAKSLADLFLSLAEKGPYDSGRVVGHRLRGMWFLGQGDAAAAKLELELSLALHLQEREAFSTEVFGQSTQVHSQSLLALATFCLGDVERALKLGWETLLAADVLRHPHSTALAICYVGCSVFGFCQANDHLLHEAKRLIALSEQHRLGGFRAHGIAFLGWALCQHGKLEQGITLLNKAIIGFDAAEYRLGVAGHLGNLADAQRRIGRVREAKASSARALDMTFSSTNGWLEPELLRIDALVEGELSPENRARSVAMLRQAAQRAHEMGSPVFERRCLLSLKDRVGVAQENLERLRETAHLDNLKGLVDSIVGSADLFSWKERQIPAGEIDLSLGHSRDSWQRRRQE
jgi:class 3 adenylate cyclase/tetratricopeptide (TPR) repeat protein